MSRLAETIRAPERVGAVTLADGRALGWAQWGPPDGWPVLFFSGAAMGRTLGFGADGLERRGVRLIAVDRPGIGASDPAPARTLGRWADDVRQLVAALDARDHGLVAFSMGAPFGLACAAAGLPRAVAIVSGQDDLHDPAIAALLDPRLREMAAAAAADPTGFAAGFAAQASPELIWSLAITGSAEVDLAVYTDASFSKAYRACLEEGFAQGAGGYALDFALAAGRWPFAPERIAVPVDLWYGARDSSTVHSPDHGARMARRIRGSFRHLVGDAGASLLWTSSDQILAALVDAAASTDRVSQAHRQTKG